MKECKIVQDLLPNYIEKLTNEETNEYIEKHLEQCKECSEVLKNMQKEITGDKNNSVEKQTKYLKKYNKKLRIFEIIVLIIILAFVVNTGRKMIIIKSLQEKTAQYNGIDNYHIKVYNYNNEYTYERGIYQKGEKYKTYSYSSNYSRYGGVLSINETFGDSSYSNMYIRRYCVDENITIKRVMQSSHGYSSSIQEFIGDSNLKKDNFWELLFMALTSKVSSENCNLKDCYRIDYTVFTGWPPYPIPWQQEHYSLIDYIEKDTGLLIRRIGNEVIHVNHQEPEEIKDFSYEFGNVTEEDLKEPDMNEYEIEKLE